MANCDMCGKITEKLFITLVEGTELNVCKKCSNFGKIIKKKKSIKKQKIKQDKITKHEKELIQEVREDYSDIIRKKRERLGLKQKELAVKLAERESLVQKVETGKIIPSLKLSRKLEKFLNIELVVQKEVENTSLKKTPGKLTIGDIIKI